MKHSSSMNIMRLTVVLLLCMFAWPTAAEELPTEEESQRYYFSLMEKAQTFRVHPGAAPKYLRGVWRLDRKAHVGGGHYVMADRGDDVTLICNDERLIQIDFNRHDSRFVESTEQLSDLTGSADGSMHFGNKKTILMPLDENHVAVARYDYIAVLKRASGTPSKEGPVAYPVEQQQ